MNTAPNARWYIAPMANPATPIDQDSTYTDTEALRFRVRVQSLATRTGKAAPLPASVEEAQAILAALDAEQ